MSKDTTRQDNRLIDEATLMDVDLLREFNGRWKYRFLAGASWMTATSKQGAICMASEAYAKASKGQLLTRAQRAEKADKDEYDEIHKSYGKYTVAELQDRYDAAGRQITSLQSAAVREFNGNGGRRTAAAVAAEGARETAEFRKKLKRYMNKRWPPTYFLEDRNEQKQED